MGIEDGSTLFASYTNTLGMGTYYAQVASFGGHAQDTSMSGFNASDYFDMGAFFLTGSGFDLIPEPASFVLLAFAVGFFSMRREAR